METFSPCLAHNSWCLYSVVVGSNGGYYFCNRMITFLFSQSKTSFKIFLNSFLVRCCTMSSSVSSGSSGHHAERAAIFMSKAGSTFHCFYWLGNQDRGGQGSVAPQLGKNVDGHGCGLGIKWYTFHCTLMFSYFSCCFEPLNGMHVFSYIC